MTPQFTTPCFVRVDDKDKRREVCEKLEPVGYKIKVDYTDDINPIVIASKLGILHDASSIENPKFIDCGTDIDLFLALAGMRDDTDKGQWFKKGSLMFKADESGNISIPLVHYLNSIPVTRATTAEIVKHFKTKEK